MFKSLRWRLQAWHAVVLLIVLTSFGGVVYGLHWRTRLQQVDGELHRATNAVMSQSWRLVPWRPRRREPTRQDADFATRVEQNLANRQGTGELLNRNPTPDARELVTPGDAAQQPLNETPSRSPIADAREPAVADAAQQRPNDAPTRNPIPDAREQAASGPRERPFREPDPPPAEFEELFHGDEESRLYFIIWGRNGKVLQKSDSAPDLEYPDLHAELAVRLPRDRRADHLYREVITCVPMPRPPMRAGDQGPHLPFDWNILVGRSIDKDIVAQHHSGLRLIAIGLIILSGGVLGAGWLSARAIRPIDAMTATAEAISAQNLSERIDVSDTDSELGKLATVLNGSFDRLQDAVERQRQFTADASHELRTPLSVIAAHTELALSRERSSEEYQATLETCWRASQRMKSLIDSLLLLARFDSGTPSMNRSRVDLDSLIRECVELVEPLATARGIRIDCETVASPVWADAERLIQVVTNLMTNAIRYNVDGGSIHVSNRIESATAVICVTDTGVGISADQLPRIFDRFYQVDKARSRAEGSCGLGLSICKTIVEAHGGTISATSQIDVGTTVQVRLPVGAVNASPAERELNERRLASSLAEA